jgi:hypothetical protein
MTPSRGRAESEPLCGSAKTGQYCIVNDANAPLSPGLTCYRVEGRILFITVTEAIRSIGGAALYVALSALGNCLPRGPRGGPCLRPRDVLPGDAGDHAAQPAWTTEEIDTRLPRADREEMAALRASADLMRGFGAAATQKNRSETQHFAARADHAAEIEPRPAELNV